MLEASCGHGESIPGLQSSAVFLAVNGACELILAGFLISFTKILNSVAADVSFLVFLICF